MQWERASTDAESGICLTASHCALLSFKLLSKMGVRNLHRPRLLCRAKTAGALHQAAAVLRLLVQKHQLTFAPKHCPVARCSHSHGALVGTAAFTLSYCALLCLPPPTKLLWASGNQDNFTYSDKWHSSVCFLTENKTFRRQWEGRELHWLAVSGTFNIFFYIQLYAS